PRWFLPLDTHNYEMEMLLSWIVKVLCYIAKNTLDHQRVDERTGQIDLGHPVSFRSIRGHADLSTGSDMTEISCLRQKLIRQRKFANVIYELEFPYIHILVPGLINPCRPSRTSATTASLKRSQARLDGARRGTVFQADSLLDLHHSIGEGVVFARRKLGSLVHRWLLVFCDSTERVVRSRRQLLDSHARPPRSQCGRTQRGRAPEPRL